MPAATSCARCVCAAGGCADKPPTLTPTSTTSSCVQSVLEGWSGIGLTHSRGVWRRCMTCMDAGYGHSPDTRPGAAACRTAVMYVAYRMRVHHSAPPYLDVPSFAYSTSSYSQLATSLRLPTRTPSELPPHCGALRGSCMYRTCAGAGMAGAAVPGAYRTVWGLRHLE